MKIENRFFVRILSPVHIGCDEVYEPMNFVVDENACTLTTFDPLNFFRNLSSGDKTKFADISRKGTISSLLELSQFMRGKKTEGYRVKACSGLIEHYKQNLSIRPGDDRKIQNEINKFSIFRTAFNYHTSQPYLPGSSIKGALRTAYLNTLQAQKKLPSGYRDSKKLETDLLEGGSFNTDPFRLLKVSDFVPVIATTKIVYAVNEKKKPTGISAQGPYQILEIVETESVFVGTIAMEDRYLKEAGIKISLTIEALLKSARLFYGNDKSREDNELKIAELPVLNLAESDGGSLIRIGRHSGAEAVTIEDHRNIKLMQKRGENPKFGKGATTFWLAADASKNYSKLALKPFGWVLLGEMTEEMFADFKDRQTAATEQPCCAIIESFETLPSGSPRIENSEISTTGKGVAETVIVRSPLQKILDELKLIKSTDAGRLGPIIQKIENLQSDIDKIAAATTFKDKLGKDLFKKSKFRSRIEALMLKET